MIVDDDAGVRRMLARGLSRAGYEVYSSEGGLPALSLVEVSRPNILLVDYMMRLPGPEIVRHIRALYGSSVYICVLTGNAEAAVRDCCLSAGADDVVEKPISLGELRMRLYAGMASPRSRVA